MKEAIENRYSRDPAFQVRGDGAWTSALLIEINVSCVLKLNDQDLLIN